MKIVDTAVITEIAGDKVLVDVNAEGADSFHGIIKMNETAGYMVEALKEDITLDELVDKVMAEYEGASREKIMADAVKLTDELRRLKLIIE